MRGFTLIELLVTLTIIAILSTVGLLTFREVLQGSRDGKRQTDLKQIQSALEQYRADQTFYPVDNGVNNVNTILTSGNSLKNDVGLGSGTLVGTLKTYLNKMPQDPFHPTSKYCYAASPPSCTNAVGVLCTGYTLYAKLEKVTGALTCTGGTGGYSLPVGPP